MNIFEAAVRQKLRFGTSKGALSVEDLWDLPLSSATGKVSLNEIALTLHHKLKAEFDVVSFVDDSVAKDPTTQLRFDIVKHVIDQRRKENADAATAKVRAETKQQLLSALARKRETAIDALSEDELVKKLAEL